MHNFFDTLLYLSIYITTQLVGVFAGLRSVKVLVPGHTLV